VTESLYIRTASRARLAKLHFAAAATFAYLFTITATAQEEPEEPAPTTSAETDAAGETPEDSEAAAESDVGVDASAETSTPEEGDGVVVAEGGGLFEGGGTTDTPSADAKGSGFSFDLGGYTRGDVFVGVTPGTREPSINAAYGEISLQMNAKKDDWGSAFADFRVRYGQQLSTNDLFLDLREAYVNAYLGPLDIRVGKQIIVWGRADAFNPTSNITPVDFRIRSPVEDDRRIGNVGARAFLNLLPVRIEAVWMPLYQPTIYPDIQMAPYVYFADPNYPSLSVRDGTYAGRVHLELPAFEASVSYLYGSAPLPGFALNTLIAPGDVEGTDAVEPGAVYISRTSYKQHVVGVDFSTAIGDLFGLRGEAAFRSPINQAATPWAAKPDVQWVLGIDREFGDVMIIAQYLGRYTIDWEAKHPVSGDGTNALCCVSYDRALTEVNAVLFNSNQMLFSQLHQLQSLASLRLEWKALHEKLNLSVLGLVNFNTTEWLLLPKIGYQITGGLSAYLGAEIFAGPDGTLFGQIDDTLSAGYVELRLTY